MCKHCPHCGGRLSVPPVAKRKVTWPLPVVEVSLDSGERFHLSVYPRKGETIEETGRNIASQIATGYDPYDAMRFGLAASPRRHKVMEVRLCGKS